MARQAARAMIVVPFEALHLRMIRVQPSQIAEYAHADALDSPTGLAWTAFADGEPLACAGLVEVWEGRAYAWAILSVDAGRYMLALTRGIRSRLAAAPFRRIEMAVDAGFAAGARWAQLLGFRCETPEPMTAYLPNGRAAYLYART